MDEGGIGALLNAPATLMVAGVFAAVLVALLIVAVRRGETIAPLIAVLLVAAAALAFNERLARSARARLAPCLSQRRRRRDGRERVRKGGIRLRAERCGGRRLCGGAASAPRGRGRLRRRPRDKRRACGKPPRDRA